jgi:hypothetical protein
MPLDDFTAAKHSTNCSSVPDPSTIKGRKRVDDSVHDQCFDTPLIADIDAGHRPLVSALGPHRALRSWRHVINIRPGHMKMVDKPFRQRGLSDTLGDAVDHHPARTHDRNMPESVSSPPVLLRCVESERRTRRRGGVPGIGRASGSGPQTDSLRV